MNILSMFTIVMATVIAVVTINNINKEYNPRLRIWLLLVEFTLSWWCLCFSFFFSAQEKEMAFLWLRVSSIGWSTFSAFVAMYFIVYTGQEGKYKAPWKKLLFFAGPIILLIENLFGKDTSIAVDLIQSTSGLGWTYISDIKSPWYWFFIIQIIVYFGIAFTELTQYQKTAKFKLKKELAISFIILDSTALLIGGMTDFILPHFTHILPPLSTFGIGLFQIGYILFIHHYDIFNIDNIITSGNILETSMNPVILMDSEGEILRCNMATSDVLGYDKSYIVGKKLKDFFLSRHQKEDIINKLFKDKKLRNVETQMVNKKGEIKNVLLSATIAEDKRNEFQGIVVSLYDVTEMIHIRQQLEESNKKYRQLADELYHLSHYDQLTQLPNRRMFYDALERFRVDYSENKVGFAVIYMDLDGFKLVNDTYGHEVGDKVLIEVAQKLKKVISEEYFIARMGGDEFICIISGDNIEYFIKLLVEQIEQEFKAPIIIEEKQCEVGISLGYSIYESTLDFDKLIKEADDAMYQQKNINKDKK